MWQSRHEILGGPISLHYIIDSFEVSSTHGHHLYLVHQTMGIFPNVKNIGLPIPLVKYVAKQLLLALCFLHQECHISHTDIKPHNILVQIENMDTAFDIQEESRLAASTDMISTDLPNHVILSDPIREFTSDELLNLIRLSKVNVRLTDFGTALPINGFHSDIIQPLSLRAPEVILGCEWDTSVDIWNLGCLIFEFITGHWLFVPRGGPTWTAEAYHLAHMPTMAVEDFNIGDFRTGKHMEQYFGPDGTLRIQVGGVRGLEEALKSYNVVNDDELASATDLIQHEWLKG